MKTRAGSTKLSAEGSPEAIEVDLTRRGTLKLLGAAAGSLLIPSFMAGQEVEAPQMGGVPLTPFADPLPIPPTLQPKGQVGGKPFYRVELSQFQQTLHR